MPREPLNNSVRGAFQSEKPQIVWCDASDSSRRYDLVAQRARCGFSGETHMGRARDQVRGRLFAGHPPRFDSLIRNDQTTRADRFPAWRFLPLANRSSQETALAEATLADPEKTPSCPGRIIQRFLSLTTLAYRTSDLSFEHGLFPCLKCSG